MVCTGGLDELAADVFGLGDARHLDDNAVVGLAGRRRSGRGEEQGVREMAAGRAARNGGKGRGRPASVGEAQELEDALKELVAAMEGWSDGRAGTRGAPNFRLTITECNGKQGGGDVARWN